MSFDRSKESSVEQVSNTAHPALQAEVQHERAQSGNRSSTAVHSQHDANNSLDSLLPKLEIGSEIGPAISGVINGVEDAQAASLIHTHSGVSSTDAAAVEKALIDSPQSVKNTVLNSKTDIEVYTNAQQYQQLTGHSAKDLQGDYGFYVSGKNQVVLFSDNLPNTPLSEISEHEFAHVLDDTGGKNSITGSAGFQKAFNADYSRLSPAQRSQLLGGPIGLDDGPMLHNIGTGDVYAELVTSLANEDQTGEGRLLKSLLPQTYAYLYKTVGTGSGNYPDSSAPIV